jgi:hypothetical protein
VPSRQRGAATPLGDTLHLKFYILHVLFLFLSKKKMSLKEWKGWVEIIKD